MSNGVEAHNQLRVVVERLDAEDRTGAELCVFDARPGPQGSDDRLILVLVCVSRLFFLDPAAAAVRIGAELVVREVPLVRR